MEGYFPLRRSNPSCPANPLQQLFRPTAALRDIQARFGAGQALFQEELDVILEVTLMTLNSFPHTPMQGTIILDGQKCGEEARCIFRANLSGGHLSLAKDSSAQMLVAKLHPDSLNTLVTSDTVAECCIDNVLESDLFTTPDSRLCGLVRQIDTQYPESRFNTLVLNTTNGRFLAACITDSPDTLPQGRYEDMVLLAIAQSIAMIRLEDIGLQQSMQQIEQHYREAHYAKYLELLAAVRQLFTDYAHHVFREWQT